MNLRKFYFIICSILSVFMFFTGVFILGYISSASSSTSSPVNSFLDSLKTSDEPVNILLLGGDRVAHNSDTMMLINFNPSTAKLSILSIPRDTKVYVKGSSIPKINAALPIGGADLAVETVSSLLNVNIKYYVYIDTSAFREIINTLGGVDYYVPVDLDYDDPVQNLHIHLKKGQQHLDGSQSEQLVRFRHPTHYNSEIKKFYDGSDIKRINVQQDFIKEVVRQKTSAYYLLKLNDIINIVFNNLETNISLSDTLKLAQSLSKLTTSDISMFMLPGTDKLEDYWYWIMDKEASAKIVETSFGAKEGYLKGPVNTPLPIKSKSSSKKNTYVKKATPTAKSFTKNNPSNGDTSIKGSTKVLP